MGVVSVLLMIGAVFIGLAFIVVARAVIPAAWALVRAGSMVTTDAGVVFVIKAIWTKKSGPG